MRPKSANDPLRSRSRPVGVTVRLFLIVQCRSIRWKLNLQVPFMKDVTAQRQCAAELDFQFGISVASWNNSGREQRELARGAFDDHLPSGIALPLAIRHANT